MYHNKVTLSDTDLFKGLATIQVIEKNGTLNIYIYRCDQKNPFVFSTILNLNIKKKIDKNDRNLLSLRLQSLREVGGESIEEKDHI